MKVSTRGDYACRALLSLAMHADGTPTSVRDIAGEARRDLDDEAELALAHAQVEFGMVGDRRLLGEVS